jgi:coproporphyrinogen III oxidase
MITSPTMRIRMETMVKTVQDTICAEIEQIDGGAFREDIWTRNDGGGGISRVLQGGTVFEKAGVNVSIVNGTLSAEAMRALKLGGKRNNAQEQTFYATGLSLVLHPHSPLVPTVHANYRYFEMGDGLQEGNWWFGGGSDLTPSYLFVEDAMHFHRTLKEAADRHDPTFYPRFKQVCDDYFYLTHRQERRGLGGIFFDHLHDRAPEQLLAFVTDCATAFLPSYLPIVRRWKNAPYSAEQKHWQQIRHGRYVEFNLVYDRGTTFGLKTGGRTESILMSLPLTATWEYEHQPIVGSPEAELVAALQTPRDWLECAQNA